MISASAAASGICGWTPMARRRGIVWVQSIPNDYPSAYAARISNSRGEMKFRPTPPSAAAALWLRNRTMIDIHKRIRFKIFPRRARSFRSPRRSVLIKKCFLCELSSLRELRGEFLYFGESTDRSGWIRSDRLATKTVPRNDNQLQSLVATGAVAAMGTAVAVVMRAVKFLLPRSCVHFIQQRQQLALGIRGVVDGERAILVT